MINPKDIFIFDVHSDPVTWSVPQMPYVQGHFPGNPVVPGVAIIDGCLELAKRKWNGALKLASVESSKFTKPISPGNIVEIQAQNNGNKYSFTWSVGGEAAAKIVLLLN